MKTYTSIDRRVRRVTDKAVMVSAYGTNLWIPRAVIRNGDAIKQDDDVLDVETWWVQKSGLIRMPAGKKELALRKQREERMGKGPH